MHTLQCSTCNTVINTAKQRLMHFNLDKRLGVHIYATADRKLSVTEQNYVRDRITDMHQP